jgi:hypothetical protein
VVRKTGGGNFGREGVRKIEVDVETADVSAFLAPGLVDLDVWEHLSGGRLLDVR